MTEFEGGAQDSRFAGGSQQLCERLAVELGEAVTLGSPVDSIAQRGDVAVVRTPQQQVTGRRVIAAIAPPLAARIDFDPPQPAEREALVTQRVAMGAYMKAVAVYDDAWWRRRACRAWRSPIAGPSRWWSTTAPTRAARRARGLRDRRARARVGGARRRRAPAAVLDALGRAVAPEAARSSAYRDLNWLEERWSRGAPVGLMGPGTLTGAGRALRTPTGLVHWAATETATEWPGYMDRCHPGRGARAEEVARAIR